MQQEPCVGTTSTILGIILAGGRGSRLKELTEKRCKPYLPVGKNRLIDFAIANLVHSLIVPHVYVLTQYLQQGLIEHLAHYNPESPFWDRFVRALPAQQQLGDGWYEGNANAVHQNQLFIVRDPAQYVAILAADHIYKLDFRQVLGYHVKNSSAFTICVRVLTIEEAARNFGVVEVDADNRIIGFKEKPKRPKEIPGRPGYCMASMGIYMCDKNLLLQRLGEDHVDPTSHHDIGGDLVPAMIRAGDPVYAYDYETNIVPGETINVNGQETPAHCWEDIGNPDAYHRVCMDLVSTDPKLNLYNELWPISTVSDGQQGAKIVSPGDRPDTFCGAQAVVAGGGIFTSNQRLHMCMLGRRIRVGEDVVLERTVVLDNVVIDHSASLVNCIVEERVYIPPDCRIGFSEKEDDTRGIRVTPGGIRIVTTNATL